MENNLSTSAATAAAAAAAAAADDDPSSAAPSSMKPTPAQVAAYAQYLGGSVQVQRD
jgi:hypothetical protein